MRAGSWEAHPSEGERKREMPCGDDDEGALAPCGACMGGGALGRGNMAMGEGASLQGACCGWGLEEVYMRVWEGEMKEGRKCGWCCCGCRTSWGMHGKGSVCQLEETHE